MDKVLAKFKRENPGITIEFMDSFRTAATYSPSRKKIRLAKVIYRHNSDAGLDALLTHEKAHFRVFNHGPEFKKELKALGGDKAKTMRVTRYVLVCPECHNIHYFNNRESPNLIYFCEKCHEGGNKVNMVLYKYVNDQKGVRDPK